MPTYEYECRACGKTCEYFQSFSEASKTKCPACGKSKLSRLIGAGAGFLFKGSGFYTTDYRSSDYKARAKADTGSSPAAPASAPSSGAATSGAASGGSSATSGSSGGSSATSGSGSKASSGTAK
jgi:putative FmdB family regulatory protein